MKLDLTDTLSKAQQDLMKMSPAVLDFLVQAGLFTCHEENPYSLLSLAQLDGIHQSAYFDYGMIADGYFNGLVARTSLELRHGLLDAGFNEGEGLVYRVKVGDTYLTYVGAGLSLINDQLRNSRPKNSQTLYDFQRSRVWNFQQLIELNGQPELDEGDWIRAGFVQIPDSDYLNAFTELASMAIDTPLVASLVEQGDTALGLTGMIAYERKTGLPVYFTWYENQRYMGGWVHQSFHGILRAVQDLIPSKEWKYRKPTGGRDAQAKR